jgi:hypothetical protein
LTLYAGVEILASITPTFLNTTPATIARFDPVDRDCYQDHEFRLPNLIYDGGYRDNDPVRNSSGVDVMIAIFCGFCQISAEKWRLS